MIEPIIGHMKSDHGMDRNWLKGEDGDHINALMEACGFNMKELLRAFLCLLLGSLYRLGLLREKHSSAICTLPIAL